MEPSIFSLAAIALPAFAAAIAIGLWITRSFCPWCANMFKKILGIDSLQRQLTLHIQESSAVKKEMVKELREITKEFRPNSGETVRDALNRIESSVDLTGERQRARMLDATEMLVETDKLGNVVWVNRTMVRHLGRLPGELYGNGWLNIFHPKDRDRVRTEWQEVIEEGRDLEVDAKILTAGRKAMDVIIRSYLMHDVKGVVLGWLLSFNYNGQKEKEKLQH